MPTGQAREQRIAQVFAEFAELSRGEDEGAIQLALARRCVELLGVDVAAVALSDAAGRLRPAVGAAADDAGRPADGQQARRGISSPVSTWRLDSERRRGGASELWMRARGEVIGVVTVTGGTDRGLDPVIRQVGQALADAAANALLVLRERRQSELLADQLQHALTSRIVIEQAVGILAERWQVDVQQAFQRMRQYVRSHNLRLRDVAEAVVARDIEPFSMHRKEQPSRSR